MTDTATDEAESTTRDVIVSEFMSIDGVMEAPEEWLFENLDREQIELEWTRVVESLGVTHLRFRVVRKN